MAKQQSLTRLTAKHVARIQGHRTAKTLLGNGFIGAIAATCVSALIKQTDKYELHKDNSFGTTSIERKTNNKGN